MQYFSRVIYTTDDQGLSSGRNEWKSLNYLSTPLLTCPQTKKWKFKQDPPELSSFRWKVHKGCIQPERWSPEGSDFSWDENSFEIQMISECCACGHATLEIRHHIRSLKLGNDGATWYLVHSASRILAIVSLHWHGHKVDCACRM